MLQSDQQPAQTTRAQYVIYSPKLLTRSVACEKPQVSVQPVSAQMHPQPEVKQAMMKAAATLPAKSTANLMVESTRSVGSMTSRAATPAALGAAAEARSEIGHSH